MVLSVKPEYPEFSEDQCRLDVKYQYTVNGKRYQSDNVTIEGTYRCCFESTLRKKTALFQENETCAVYVNPEKADESVLIPGYTPNGTVPLAITGFL